MGNLPWALFLGGRKIRTPTLGPWALPLGGPKVPHYYLQYILMQYVIMWAYNIFNM